MTTSKAKLLFADTTVNTGGLLRCCIATIEDYVNERLDESAPNELVIECRAEKSDNIILKDGVWSWNHE